MRTLSKSKLLAFRQCPKRLWLEIHRPALRQDSSAVQAGFEVGYKVGDIARRIYDPEGRGQLIDPQAEGFAPALARSSALLTSSQAIFEAGFSAGGALAFADVMLPMHRDGKQVWRMVEVKSSTRVKDYHLDDVAIQTFVVRNAGVPLASIALAHIDSKWVYPGQDDYVGLLAEQDLTEQAFGRADEVRGWIAEAQKISARPTEPLVTSGNHCTQPYECGFLEYCQSQEPQAEYPLRWLPQIRNKKVMALIRDKGINNMRQIPDELLNERQIRVKSHTLSGQVYFDGVDAAADLAAHPLPAYFLDFETIQFPIPIWKGTRPYQMIPFQFSLHRLGCNGKMEKQSFLDLSGEDPSKNLAECLIAACGERGPIFVYNANFEKSRIKEIGLRFPQLESALLSINGRIVDLLPVAQQRYYHPSQQGSWSIKKVLPAIAPDLSYAALDGVKDGGMAMTAYLEALAASTTKARKDQIEQQLLEYCNLDTYAMVRLWRFFTGYTEPAV